MAAGDMISIVDDDASMRNALVDMLRSLGYDARGFASAEDMLASGELDRFACMVTDIQMPGMSGFDLARELHERGAPLPVIMVTARTEPGLEEKAMSCGAACFLRKPFETQIFVACVERALSTSDSPG
jgi:FixJ family two-component response regulator